VVLDDGFRFSPVRAAVRWRLQCTAVVMTMMGGELLHNLLVIMVVAIATTNTVHRCAYFESNINDDF